MRVLLTKPWLPKKQRTIITLPFGSLYLASYLKKMQSGLDVAILDPDIEPFADEKEFYAKVIALQPEIIGVTIFSHVVPFVKKDFLFLKSQLPSLRLIGGGPHINALKERSFSVLPFFDFFIYGEGEKGFCNLCGRINDSKNDFSEICGLVYKNGERIIANPNDFTEDLSAFDPLDYSLINLQQYREGSPMGLFHKGKYVAQILTTRGCPYPCTFCAASLNTGKKVRTRSIDLIIDDIRILHENGFDEIHIMDDNFSFHKEHAISFCNKVADLPFKMHFALPNGIRLDRLDDELLSALKKAGFYHIGFGIEVGSDESLKIIKKRLTLADAREKIKLAKRFKIGTSGFFILGFPHETERDIKETIRVSGRLGLDLLSFGNFTPLPGTELFNDLVNNKEISEDYTPSFASGIVTYSPKAVSEKTLVKLQKSAIVRYYLQPRVLTHIAAKLRFRDLKYALRRLYHILFRPVISD